MWRGDNVGRRVSKDETRPWLHARATLLINSPKTIPDCTEWEMYLTVNLLGNRRVTTRPLPIYQALCTKLFFYSSYQGDFFLKREADLYFTLYGNCDSLISIKRWLWKFLLKLG